jgi:EAL domain-containing protein (putative c-di-GMP-specific phosphodiesterase class I)
VVAEGVADEEDAELLQEMGCEFAQSFLFGPPIPAEIVQKILREQANSPQPVKA